MAGPPVVVPLRPECSDGDPTHRPPVASTYSESNPTIYLEKVGMKWMADRGESRPGVKYILQELPHGYALYERPRSNGRPDKYLFGHPAHKFFDSPNRFYPHFKHLMENEGSSMGCPCTVCDPRGGVLPGRPAPRSGHFSSSKGSSGPGSGSGSRRMCTTSSKTGSGTSLKKSTLATQSGASNPSANNGVATAKVFKPMGRPKVTLAGMDTTRVDDEGTPDVYRNLIDRLKRQGSMDEVIKEPLSLDWRSEQEIIPELLKKLGRDPQWTPRVGDILLFARNVPEGFQITQEPDTGMYKLYDQDNDKWLKIIWEAGLVGQVPAKVAEGGGVGEKEDDWYVGQSGVRMESLPDPNDMEKSLSKRHTYVPVEHTRPFFLWQEYVGPVPRDERHVTIQNAFTASATMSLMGKHRFQGNWPNAQIFCHAIYIGTEMVAVGDTVRLAPKGGHDDVSTDILIIKSIRLKLSKIHEASYNDYDEGRPYNSEVWVYGSAYTTIASRSSKEWLSEHNTEVPKAASGYGDWYPLHPSNKELAVPFSRIVGRLYEYDAVRSWIYDEPDLDTGRDGVIDARHFASKNDQRIIANSGTTWFWADSRADALDLQTINGFDVSKHDIERDPKEWRKQIQVIEAGGAEGEAANRKPAPGMRSLRGFMAPASVSGMQDAQESNSSRSSVAVGKRPNEVSDNEEAYRRETRVVTDVPYKKHKIQVLID